LNLFFSFLGYKFKIEIWKDKSNKIELLGTDLPLDTQNFWEELSK
jgi:hypothetical protein